MSKAAASTNHHVEKLATKQRAMGRVRDICKDYGQSFRPRELVSEEIAARDNGAKDPDKPRHVTRKMVGPKGSASKRLSRSGFKSPSSSSDLSSHDEKDELAQARTWEELKKGIDEFQLGRRAQQLEEINSSLQETASRASQQVEQYLGTRDVIEPIAGVDNEEPNDVLTFDVQELAATKALERCIGAVPKIKEMVEARKLAEQEQADSDPSPASSARSGGTEMQVGVSELMQEVNKRIKDCGEMPPNAHEYLKVLLGKQQEELRSWALQLPSAEHEALVIRAAQAAVEGRLSSESTTVEVFNAARGKADSFWEEALEIARRAERRRIAEELAAAGARNATSNEEAGQAHALKISKLKNRLVVINNEIERVEGDIDRSAMDFRLDEAESTLGELKNSMAAQQDALALKEKQCKDAQQALLNAEKGLRLLEDVKVVFVEEVVRANPERFEELYGVEEDDTNSESEDSYDLADDEGRLQRLAAEEAALRERLMPYEAESRGGSLSGKDQDGGTTSGERDSEVWSDAGDPG